MIIKTIFCLHGRFVVVLLTLLFRYFFADLIWSIFPCFKLPILYNLLLGNFGNRFFIWSVVYVYHWVAKLVILQWFFDGYAISVKVFYFLCTQKLICFYLMWCHIWSLKLIWVFGRAFAWDPTDLTHSGIQYFGGYLYACCQLGKLTQIRLILKGIKTILFLDSIFGCVRLSPKRTFASHCCVLGTRLIGSL